MVKVPHNREPTHPGVLLRRIIAETKGLTQEKLAHQIGVSSLTISMVVNGRRGVSAELALRLARRFRTDAQSWLNMQQAVDIWRAEQALKEEHDAA